MSTKQGNRSRTSINRRDLIRVAGVGATGVLILDANRRGALAFAPAAQDAATITFWTPGGSPLYCETMTEIADYGDINSDVTVNFQCGTDPDAFQERLLSSIAAGNPPDATVYWDTPVALGVRGAVMALDDLMATAEYAGVQNWPAGVLASCQYG